MTKLENLQEQDEQLVEKWEPLLEGISDDYTQRITAQLLENQAKEMLGQSESLNEDITAGATTTGQLGTYAKFAFPLVRRMYPDLILNSIAGVQPMGGPVSQVFYIGNSRTKDGTTHETVYSKFNLTYKDLVAGKIDSISGDGGGLVGLAGDDAISGFDTSNLFGRKSDPAVSGAGSFSGTVGGQIAAFPNANSVLGFQTSAGERLAGTGIPEMTFHIEQEAVVANTRKMRALWTLEASQDLKAYHNLDLERELTDLLSKELQLEIDRELIEDLRMIAYGLRDRNLGGVDQRLMDSDYVSLGTTGERFPGLGGATNAADATTFVPAQFTYDFASDLPTTGSESSNIFVIDFSQSSLSLYPRHVGEVYSNLLAIINLASQDIYRTTMRGPGNWLLTSPLVASLLESASKLEGGVQPADGPTNIGGNSIEYKGKFMGRYDLYVDPMYPTDEIMVGYKGANAMDAGYIYAPYIPLQQLPTITDPESFQPRKGILTRYGKVQIEPYNRFYRIIRIIGPTANYLFSPFARNTTALGTSVS